MAYMTKGEDRKSQEALAAYHDGFETAMRNESRNASSYESIHERRMYSLGYADGRNVYEIRRIKAES